MQLMDFNARFYSPTLGRFIQPDTVVPDLTNSQAWNRYSYVLNSPLMYVDPSGHIPEELVDDLPCPDGDCTLYELPQTELWLGGLSEGTIASTHQYQLDGNQSNPNECAVTSLAMAVTLLLREQGINDITLQYHLLAAELDENWFYFRRIPGNFQYGGGATHPTGIASAAAWISISIEGMGYDGFDWDLKAGGTTDELIHNLEEGNPTIIYGVHGQNMDIPHAMVVVGYSQENDEWALLDPARSPNTKKPFRIMNSSELLSFWTNFSFLYGQGTMITLIPN
jgi:hypothetical protein